MSNYEIIEKTEESSFGFSERYNATVTRVPVYCKLPDGREVFLLNRLTGAIESSRQKDPYLVRDIEEHKKEIEAFVAQLKENGGKWFDRYCRWTWHPKETMKLGPLEFIDWVESRGYTFEKNITDLIIEDGRTSFGGNLNEYSCAFRYDIFDDAIVEEIKRRIPKIKKKLELLDMCEGLNKSGPQMVGDLYYVNDAGGQVEPVNLYFAEGFNGTKAGDCFTHVSGGLYPVCLSRNGQRFSMPEWSKLCARFKGGFVRDFYVE